jgi:hypothetical protein
LKKSRWVLDLIIFIELESSLDRFWQIMFSELDLPNKPMSQVMSYIHQLPHQVCCYIDPALIIDKITIMKNVDGVEVKEITNLGNQNLKKIIEWMVKLEQHIDVYSADEQEIEAKQQVSQEFYDICHQLVIKKIEILDKGKGKLRMSLEELIAFDTIISDILCNSEECNSEYLMLYTLFLKHFHDHHQSYTVNEDVAGLVRCIYSWTSKYFDKARSESAEVMDLISTNILPKYTKIISTWFKPKIVIQETQEEDNDLSEEGKQDENGESKSKAMNVLIPETYKAPEHYFDQNELFTMLDCIFTYLPSSNFHRNLVISKVEDRISKEFDRVSPGGIITLINKIHQLQDGVSVSALTELERQFLNGRVTDLFPKQIAQLMRICHSSDISKFLCIKYM